MILPTSVRSLLPGLALVLAACSEPLTICTSEARAGLRVVVRDSVTGAGLAGSTVGLAREGAYVETLQGADSVVWGAYERAGTYRIELSSPGYDQWVRDGVRVQDGTCHVETVRMTALLVPQ